MLHICLALVSCEDRGGFTCDGDKCLSSAWICDGDRDCMDGADEQNCKGKKMKKKTARVKQMSYVPQKHIF